MPFCGIDALQYSRKGRDPRQHYFCCRAVVPISGVRPCSPSDRSERILTRSWNGTDPVEVKNCRSHGFPCVPQANDLIGKRFLLHGRSTKVASSPADAWLGTDPSTNRPSPSFQCTFGVTSNGPRSFFLLRQPPRNAAHCNLTPSFSSVTRWWFLRISYARTSPRHSGFFP